MYADAVYAAAHDGDSDEPGRAGGGVSFAFMPEVSLLPSCLPIGCTTFVLCFAGGMVGGKIPGISCKTAGIAGGVVLCAIGIKLLIEGLAG